MNTGETSGCDMGQVSAIHQVEHHHVRRLAKKLSDESCQRTENQAVQKCTHVEDQGQGAHQVKRVLEENSYLAKLRRTRPQTLGIVLD